MRNNHNNQGEEKDKEQAVEDPPMTHTTSQGMPHQNESKDTKESHYQSHNATVHTTTKRWPCSHFNMCNTHAKHGCLIGPVSMA